MDPEKLLRLMESRKEEIRRELTMLDSDIARLESLLRELVKEMELVNDGFKVDPSEKVRTRYASLSAKKRDVYRQLMALQTKREELLRSLEDVMIDIQALRILCRNRKREEEATLLKREITGVSFLHMLRKASLLLLFIVGTAGGEGALQKKMKEQQRRVVEEGLTEISKDIDLKLKRLEEEKKRLNMLRRQQPQEERSKEYVEKLVNIFNKASPDEAGAIMNNMDPHLVAQILVRLKERQAASILEAMDPQKAAEVSQIILKIKGSR
ncbi:hypothetical protein Thal_0319 [Thermocrinis albus DSM 14484]|uniref:Magnesium transporter MgtE intracellular domain-containing protein n=1 Tax=Thermocrinis albus (strain DSM 14484 / JCM 11386 / HI 11/12) TaxID=638303 RepID=D3SP67_THEAH|nr:hypothetical protein [Thermocrinis albus]ADC88954.1 hypothetical protein Thal_0319 [Thermocrinis albus DSM 14484]